MKDGYSTFTREEGIFSLNILSIQWLTFIVLYLYCYENKEFFWCKKEKGGSLIRKSKLMFFKIHAVKVSNSIPFPFWSPFIVFSSWRIFSTVIWQKKRDSFFFFFNNQNQNILLEMKPNEKLLFSFVSKEKWVTE